MIAATAAGNAPARPPPSPIAARTTPATATDRSPFFFSSRRRHTRCGRDSSSDVCSSDLVGTGDPGEAERELEPFKSWGAPLVVEVGPMPYPAMNTLLDAGFPAGSLNYWLSSFTHGLPDELIDIAVERFASVPSPMTAILFEHFHGAVTRVGATETAVPHRDEGWNLLLPSVWMDPADSEANIAWTRETYATMRPHFGTGRWLNYLAD